MGGMQDASHADPQIWVIFACAIAIALGTYMGGWRIIRTLGRGLTDVKPAQGFSAETSTAATILASSALGFALSTTQVASGSVIGSGLGRRGSKVRWRMAGRIALGWLLTLPAAGAVGAFAALIVRWLGPWGILADALLALAVIIGLFARSRSTRITASNAMSDVAESARAVKVKKNPPPTRRQRAIIREQERRKAEERARRKAQDRERERRRAEEESRFRAEKKAKAKADAKKSDSAQKKADAKKKIDAKKKKKKSEAQRADGAKTPGAGDAGRDAAPSERPGEAITSGQPTSTAGKDAQ
jgi:PiT family inorganic phosphate transporter